MKRQYEEWLMEIISIQEDVIRTSTGGDSFDDNYQDPNLKALPFSELETLTNMAYQSRAEIQAGRGRKVKISSVFLSKLLAKESDKETDSFSFKEWFKST